MSMNKNRIKQRESLKEICKEKNVDYNSLETLLDSATTRMFHNSRNYHQRTIDDVIKKAIR